MDQTPVNDMETQPNNVFYAKTTSVTMPTGISEGMGGIESGTNYGLPFYTEDWCGPTFTNPTDKNPIRASVFLSALDLTEVLGIVKSRYKGKESHFKHPVEAMVKAIVFKHLKCIRSDSGLVRYLKQYPEDAKLLGFTGKIPSQQAFSHFITSRLRNEGFYDIFDNLVMAIKDQLESYGIKLGKNVSIDSTPFTGKPNDRDATYNPHYKVWGYKIHGVIDADHYLPLAFNFTTINAGDCPHYLPLLVRLNMLGIEFEKVLADGAYSSIENFAVANHHYKARTVFNLRENTIFKEEGTEKGVHKEYNKLWMEEGFDPDAGHEYKLSFLMFHGKLDVVGSVYRNKHFKEWNDDPVGMKQEYNKRAGIEAFHGFMKERLYLEKSLNTKGIGRVELHVLMCYISLLCVGLCRLQNGVTTGLAKVECLI